MKVVAFNGSPRKDGNTVHMINRVFTVLNQEGIDTELIQVGGGLFHGCTACYQCGVNKNNRCVQNDPVNDWIEKMRTADGIILASPTYFADITPELKALIDRAGFVARSNDSFLKRKVGAAVIALRRGGGIHAFDSINHFFLIQQMLIPGSCYWNMGFGRDKGEVLKDEEADKTMALLGENMAWLIKKTLA